jgi:hypothetical protein
MPEVRIVEVLVIVLLCSNPDERQANRLRASRLSSAAPRSRDLERGIPIPLICIVTLYTECQPSF